MTFLEAQDECLTWLDDVNASYFTRPQIKKWINNAQRELQKLMLNAGEDFYTVCSTTSTVINQRDYEFPSDFLKAMRLEKVVSGSGDTAFVERFMPMTRNEQDFVNYYSSGEPFNYLINQNSFSLFPTPNIIREIRLWYAYRVEDMVNDLDVIDAPEQYHEYVPVLAARDGFLRDGRDMGPIESKLGYLEKMLKEDAEQRLQDSPRSVVITDVDYA